MPLCSLMMEYTVVLVLYINLVAQRETTYWQMVNNNNPQIHVHTISRIIMKLQRILVTPSKDVVIYLYVNQTNMKNGVLLSVQS
jgi:hypothetical protein